MMKSDINILVVEDDTDINSLLCTILSKEGYKVRGAYSGTEARMCLEMHDYQLILLDLMLPGISGEELIAEIRKYKNNAYYNCLSQGFSRNKDRRIEAWCR